MQLVLSPYGSRGGVEPLVALAVGMRTSRSGWRVSVCRFTAAAEGCDVLVATGVLDTVTRETPPMSA